MRVYGKLAELLVAHAPTSLVGRRVLDLGAGTGAASCALPASDVVAVDTAFGMLSAQRDARPPAVVADALVLPFGDDSFDAVVAAFCLNHLEDPSAGVREAGRVAPVLLASTYAADDAHPVKGAVDAALTEAGWAPAEWYVKATRSMASWGTVADATDEVARGGLEPVVVTKVAVPFPELTPLDLVRWRLGMAHCAAFAAAHDVTARALELLPEDAGALVRSVIFIVARAR
jgi:SAM-dependent methyltransferase